MWFTAQASSTGPSRTNDGSCVPLPSPRSTSSWFRLAFAKMLVWIASVAGTTTLATPYAA